MECVGWRGHVIVCGLRGLGLRIVEQLHAAGERVVVIDEEPDPRLVRVLAGWGVPHLVASAALEGTLEEAGLAGAVAVICVERTDLRNLEITLLARDRRADVRVVSAIANDGVSRALARDGGPGAVLDVAALSAPSVVEACLARTVHEVELAGTGFLAATTRARETGTLRRLYGDLAPLAVSPEDGADPVVCPGRDHQVGLGDLVTLFGTERELTARSVPVSDPVHHVRRRPHRGRRLWRLLRTAAGLDRGLRRAALALAGLVALSTVVFRYGYTHGGEHPGVDPGMTYIDGLYVTVETIATVGFGDFSFASEPTWLRMYAVLLMVLGVTATAVLFAYLTDLLISRRAERSAGHRVASGLAGHVVLVGLGTVGVAVLTGLVARGRTVVLVERDEGNRFLSQARALGVPVIFGDATQPAVLAAANLPTASAVAILTSDDMVNIETGLSVRDMLGESWASVPVVVRVFDRTLAHTLAARFGFHNVRSTAELAAPWFVGAALGLDILATFSAAGQTFLVGGLAVEPGGGLDGLALRDLSERTRVAAIARPDGTLEHPPRRATRLAQGDRAYLIGPYSELLQVLRRSRPPS